MMPGIVNVSASFAHSFMEDRKATYPHTVMTDILIQRIL